MKKIKVGDVVKWECHPFDGSGKFIAEGIIRKVSEFKVSIEVITERYRKAFPGRKRTTIVIHNIIK